jgi:hypothetical protein
MVLEMAAFGWGGAVLNWRYVVVANTIHHRPTVPGG